MNKVSDWLYQYCAPHTLEQILGLGYLIMAISMIPRPYLAGIENLAIYYALPLITPNFFGALLALFGGVLILTKRCGRRLFAVLYLPLPIYSTCLAFYMFDRPFVGAAGTLGYIGLSICVALMYARRASLREQEALDGRA